MYEAEISRANPTAFVFLVDQSGSMAAPFGGAEEQAKSDYVATALNRLLHEFILLCTKNDGVRDYFHLAVLGYGSEIGSALGTPDVKLAPISQIADSPIRLEERIQKVPDGAGGIVEQGVRFPVWLEARSDGATRMCEAIRIAQDELAEWIESHPDAYPPVVINITDGEATDGDPIGPAAELRSLATRDGSVLMFNVHVSSLTGRKIEFPQSEDNLPDDFARRLYAMSSRLAEHMLEPARARGHTVSGESRGFSYNADMVGLSEFLTIGTRPANELR
ncbi:MAG: vWA domain-containing protein [Candidatus Limnocylindria bacterium]